MLMAPHIFFSLDLSPDILILYLPAYEKQPPIILLPIQGVWCQANIQCIIFQAWSQANTKLRLVGPHGRSCPLRHPPHTPPTLATAVHCSFLERVVDKDQSRPRPAKPIGLSEFSAPPFRGLSWGPSLLWFSIFPLPGLLPLPHPVLLRDPQQWDISSRLGCVYLTCLHTAWEKEHWGALVLLHGSRSIKACLLLSALFLPEWVTWTLWRSDVTRWALAIWKRCLYSAEGNRICWASQICVCL